MFSVLYFICPHTQTLGERGAQSNVGLVVTHGLNISTHASITNFTVFTSYHINII